MVKQWTKRLFSLVAIEGQTIWLQYYAGSIIGRQKHSVIVRNSL